MARPPDRRIRQPRWRSRRQPPRRHTALEGDGSHGTLGFPGRCGMKIYPLEFGKLWIQYAAAKHFQEEEMRMGRPTGVTVIAVLDFLGTGFCLLIGLLMILGGGFLASWINQQGGQGSAGAAGIMAGLGAAAGVFIIIIGGVCAVLGIGL